jgi:citrate lyase subunit beta/citryl-CoA lyase
MKIRRSSTIVPANKPELMEKSRSLDADVVVIDIQDAIIKTDKAKLAARAAAAALIRKGGFRSREVAVRVNSPGSPWFIEDVKAVVEAGVDSIKLTHSYGLADVLFAERVIMGYSGGREVDIQLSMDMPSALLELEDIARHATLVTCVTLSMGDFGLEMRSASHGPRPAASDEWLTFARSKIVTICRAKGWNASDMMRPMPTEPEALRAALHRSRMFGFDGVSVMYPRLVPYVNEMFGVPADELAWAKDLAAKWQEAAKGPDSESDYHTIEGKTYMRPTYEYALRTIFYDAVLRGDPESVAAYRQTGLASGDYLVERRAAPIKAKS